MELTIAPNELVAIVGPSGSGKTTLFRILLGLLSPNSGSARIHSGGQTVSLSPSTRALFAYVPQDHVLFSGTIAETMRLGVPDATEEQIHEALRIACADDFVSKLPGGIHCHLKERGGSLSVGQNQRLAIARALLRKAPVLLLDEATSGLDVATERQLMENLRRCGMVRTCILVTHRPGSAEFCNRAYEVRQGQVSEVAHGA